jgi:hypothetical protein
MEINIIHIIPKPFPGGGAITVVEMTTAAQHKSQCNLLAFGALEGQ